MEFPDGLQDKPLAHQAMLAELDPGLGHPTVDPLKGCKFPKLKELRFLFAFDPKRGTIILVGGSKAGDKSFYARMIGIAERRYENFIQRKKEMSVTHDEITASLTPERRRKIEARASQLIAQERLRNLRTALGLSQKDLAELLNVTQPAISKMERQEDMQISTLASIIAAMGGTLEITARFPGKEAVRLA
ncbi:MAG: XRE family transcriptional regulator [Desulfovibrio sp.]|nr:XRE family transcriptional regulator [Desulfovibrio sp.]